MALTQCPSIGNRQTQVPSLALTVEISGSRPCGLKVSQESGHVLSSFALTSLASPGWDPCAFSLPCVALCLRSEGLLDGPFHLLPLRLTLRRAASRLL